MSKVNLLFLIFSFTLAGIMTYQMLLPKNAEPGDSNFFDKNKKIAYILVAKHTLQSGDKLTANDIEWKAWPKTRIHARHIAKGERTIDQIIDKIIIRPLNSGAPFADDYLIDQKSIGLLATRIDPNKRAISFQTQASNAVSGLISPNDKVDIILTREVKDKADKKIIDVISEIIIKDIKLLAIDANTVPGKYNEKEPPKLVTVEVSPQQAQVIQVAKTLGSLSLSLKGLKQDETKSFSQIIRRSETIPSLISTKRQNAKQIITVIKGGKTEEIEVK